MALYFQSFLCLVIHTPFISSTLGFQYHRNYFNEKHNHHQDDPFVVVAGGSTSSAIKDSKRALMLDENYYDKVCLILSFHLLSFQNSYIESWCKN